MCRCRNITELCSKIKELIDLAPALGEEKQLNVVYKIENLCGVYILEQDELEEV